MVATAMTMMPSVRPSPAPALLDVCGPIHLRILQYISPQADHVPSNGYSDRGDNGIVADRFMYGRTHEENAPIGCTFLGTKGQVLSGRKPCVS
jgi:hypothetical protein